MAILILLNNNSDNNSNGTSRNETLGRIYTFLILQLVIKVILNNNNNLYSCCTQRLSFSLANSFWEKTNGNFIEYPFISLSFFQARPLLGI
jgi:hypothetical protein